MKGYWQGQVVLVTDSISNYFPHLEMHLDLQVSENPGDDLPVPRSGRSYWLVDDETFRRLVWKDSE